MKEISRKKKMSEQQCISKHVKFSEISAILEKLKGAGPTSSSKKDDILRRYFDSFEQFRREYRQKYGDNAVSLLLLICVKDFILTKSLCVRRKPASSQSCACSYQRPTVSGIPTVSG